MSQSVLLFIQWRVSFIHWKKSQAMLNHRGIQVGDLWLKPTELFGFGCYYIFPTILFISCQSVLYCSTQLFGTQDCLCVPQATYRQILASRNFNDSYVINLLYLPAATHPSRSVFDIQSQFKAVTTLTELWLLFFRSHRVFLVGDFWQHTNPYIIVSNGVCSHFNPLTKRTPVFLSSKNLKVTYLPVEYSSTLSADDYSSPSPLIFLICQQP